MSAKRAQISANECKFKKGNNAGNAGRPLDGDGRRDLVNLVEVRAFFAGRAEIGNSCQAGGGGGVQPVLVASSLLVASS